MHSGHAWFRTAPARGSWRFARGGRYLVALAAGGSADVVDRVMRLLDARPDRIEDVVGVIPLAGEDDVRSFAVVRLGDAEDDDGRAATVVVRGRLALDVFSVGGARRFSAGGVQPWVLAEFRNVTGLVAGDEDEVTSAQLMLPAGAREHTGGVVDATRLYWSERPVSPAPSADGVAASASAADDGRAGGDGAPVEVDERTIAYRRRRAGAPADEETRPRAAFGETIILGHAAAPAPVPTTEERTPPEAASARPAPASAPAPTPAPAPAPVPPRTGARFAFRLIPGEAYDLDAPTFIGRHPRVPAVVSGAVPRIVRVASASGEVSSTHLRIEAVGDAVVVTDLRSTNGTLLTAPGVAASRLRPGESRVVLPGTRVEIGDGNIIEIVPGSGRE